MFEIIKEEFDFYKNKRGDEEIVKTVCTYGEAKRLLETVFISDSFTKYTIRDIK